MAVRIITQKDLSGSRQREFILLAGFPKVGKSHAGLSLCQALTVVQPKATVYAIDTQGGIRPIWKTKFSHIANLQLAECPNIEAVVEAFDLFITQVHPHDWLWIESQGRLWEYAQDAGYLHTVGMKKSEYLIQRGKAPVIVQPNEFWQLVKNWYNHEILDPLTMMDSMFDAVKGVCNVLTSVELALDKPRGSSERFKAAKQLGIDVQLEGWPRLPYYPHTVVLMERESEVYRCKVLGDRWSRNGQSAEFQVTDWWPDFCDATGRI